MANMAAGSTKYTDQQIQFVIESRTKSAIEWRDIASRFAKKFGGERTSAQMRHLFNQHSSQYQWLVKQEKHPYSNFTHSDFSEIRRKSKKTKGRWFVTGASPISIMSLHDNGASAHNVFTPGLDAVRKWMEYTGGELVILPMRAHMPALRSQPSYYDPSLINFRKNFSIEFVFNENLRALDLHLNPQQMSPLTGLYRVRGGRSYVSTGASHKSPVRFNQSLIIAHAKQDMEIVGTGNNTTPRMLHTTGAITLPEYLPNRVGAIASDQHVLGGLIVEVDGDKFWVRQVQFAPDGSFCDIDGYKYTSSKRTRVSASGFRPGDIHSGRENTEVLLADERLCINIKPCETFVEDVFDGSSITHHNEGKFITRTKRLFKTLENELVHCEGLLRSIASSCGGQIVVVDSNHHEHLSRYLEEGRYLKDDNHELAHRMVTEIYDDKDPLKSRIDPNNEYIWLTSESDHLVEGVQMAGHGHLGVGGARGSLVQMERAYGAGMAGHSHTPAIRGKMFQVGHSSEKRHGYNKGISTWLNTRGVVWPGGQCQLVTVIDGRYCLDDV